MAHIRIADRLLALRAANVPKKLPINLLASRAPGWKIPVGITAIGASPYE